MPSHQNQEESASPDFTSDDSSRDKQQHIISNLAMNTNFKVHTIEDIAKLLQTSDSSSHLLAAQAVLTLLPKVKSELLNPLLQEELIPRFVHFLSYSNNTSLQHEACCVLATLTSLSIEQGDAIAKAGAVPYLIHLLGSSNPSTKEHTVLSIANIAGTNAKYTSLVKQYNILPLLLSYININRPISMLRKLSCSLQMLCSQPSHIVESPPPNLFSSLYELFHHSDPAVVEWSCWTFANLTTISPEITKEIIKLGVIPRLAELLQSNHLATIKASLRTLGNLVRSCQCQVVLDCGVLPSFHQLFSSTMSLEIQKEAINILSTISSGSQSQKQIVIEAGIIEPLLELIEKGNNSHLQLEISQALSSICVGCSSEQSLYLVHAGLVTALCMLFRSKKPMSVLLALQALQELLQACEESEILCQMIEDLGGLDVIEALQHHSDIQIYRIASAILKNFFSCIEMQPLTELDAPLFQQPSTSSQTTISDPTLDECGN